MIKMDFNYNIFLFYNVKSISHRIGIISNNLNIINYPI